MPVHRYSILIAVEVLRIRITEPFILIKIQAGPFNRRQPVAEKVKEKKFLLKTGQEEFEKLCSLDVFWLKLKDIGTTKDQKIYSWRFSLAAPKNTDRVLQNEITLERRSYSASYKLDPISSSTQQHKRNIRAREQKNYKSTTR